MPFDRFMELALYCPEFGYYETAWDPIGRRGDFFTSVSVGSLFGELLALQFARWLENSRSFRLLSSESDSRLKTQDSRPSIVEAGAHDGQLANDILTWLRERRPDLFQRLEYVIIEPSVRRQAIQGEKLAAFEGRVCWVSQIGELDCNRQSVCGIIFCNELLDAMPVQRFGWDAANRNWFEWGVVVEGEKFGWAKIRNLESRIQKSEGNSASVPPFSIVHLPSTLLEVLPDGFTIETSPAAEQWWRDAAQALRQGRLLTLDYGLIADELFQPSRVGGTLRAYHRHHVSDDPLADVGGQDLTAHVNFSAIQAAGEASGLKTELFATQAQFLTGIAECAWRTPASFGEWTPARTRQFQTLTHPDHLGRAFRVLVQSR